MDQGVDLFDRLKDGFRYGRIDDADGDAFDAFGQALLGGDPTGVVGDRRLDDDGQFVGQMTVLNAKPYPDIADQWIFEQAPGVTLEQVFNFQLFGFVLLEVHFVAGGILGFKIV